MQKGDYIDIASGLGFHLDYDQWEERGWMRMQLKDSLDEKEFRWIIYKDSEISWTMKQAGNILFKAGQKAKIQQLSQYIDLDV